MNRYTVEITPGDGSAPYFLEFCAVDEMMLRRFMSDPEMVEFLGPGAYMRIVLTIPWF
jgi:hypothetical protein